MTPSKPRVVVVGGGFGGLYATQALARAPVDVTLVDRRNHHLFQPLLYQVATGGLSPADIASPLRFVLRRQQNAVVLLDEVLDFRPEQKRAVLRRQELEYDYLIVAAGARVDYFGNDGWAAHAPGLKDIEDAREIRARVLSAFEVAEQIDDTDEQRAWLTFVVIGGGPTGVELAGAVAELARETLPKDFRHVDTRRARILLIEGANQVLQALSPKLGAKAKASLERLGVEVWTGAKVNEITESSVRVKTDDSERVIDAHTIVWAAGISATSIGGVLAERTGAEVVRGGKIRVRADCSVPGYDDVFVIGDLASLDGPEGKPLPGIAPVAMQQGRFVARVIKNRVAGRSAAARFRYRDKGELATIGRRAAVARIWKLEFSGYPAWLIWLFVHLMYLVEFENRLLVFLQWCWSYLTWNRSARLITKTPDEAQASSGAGPDGTGAR